MKLELLLCLVLSLWLTTSAQELVVDNYGDSLSASCSTTGYCTLRAAVNSLHSRGSGTVVLPAKSSIRLSYGPVVIPGNATIAVACSDGTASIQASGNFTMFSVQAGGQLNLINLDLQSSSSRLYPLLSSLGGEINMNSCQAAALEGSIPGPLLMANMSSTVTMTDCQISSCSSTVNGGALAIHSSNLTLSGCIFSDNIVTGSSGQDFSTTGNGGAIWAESSIVHINTSHFINNKASSGGGAVFVAPGTLSLNHSVLQNNSCSWEGCAVYVDGTIDGVASTTDGVDIQNTVIAYNANRNESALYTNDGSGGRAAGVYIHAVYWTNLFNATFSNNTAMTNGAAAYIDKVTWLTVKDSLFKDNWGADGPTYADGGALYYSGMLDYGKFGQSSIANTNFTGNWGRQGGGAQINNVNGHYLEGCRFVENTVVAGNGGGINFYNVHYGTAYISGCTFLRNNATDGFGGALGSIDGGFQTHSVDIQDSMFQDNTCYTCLNCTKGGEGGGAIYSINPLLIQANNTDFVGNRALGDIQGGGAILTRALANLTLVGCRLSENTAPMAGGAVMIQGEWAGTTTLIGCTWERNLATNGNGGAYYDRQVVALTITGNTFDSNQALGSSGSAGAAGAVYSIDGAGVAIKDTKFLNNIAGIVGGAVVVQLTPAAIADSHFSNNTANGWGGALMAQSSVNIEVKGTNFTSNTALYGGAMTALMVSNLQLESSYFTANNASVWGGGAALQNVEHTTVNSTHFSGNAAPVGAGLYGLDMYCRAGNKCSEGGGVQMFDSQFTDNVASNLGGGASLQNAHPANLTAVEFRQNTAALAGGGIALEDSSMVFTGCILEENKASGEEGLGGGVSCSGSDMDFTEGTIQGNYAGAGGGALSLEQKCVVTLDGTSLSGNYAGSGGAVYLSATKNTLTATTTTFSGNGAQASGGGIFCADGANAVTISDSEFQGNTCGDTSLRESLGLPVSSSGADNSTSGLILGGGALYVFNSRGTTAVTNSKFTGNSAPYGGAVFVTGASVSNQGRASDGSCEAAYSFLSDTFEDNSASEAGGAVYWETENPPCGLEGTDASTFTGNTAAQVLSDQATPPSSLVVLRDNIPEASGQVIANNITVCLLDAYGANVTTQDQTTVQASTPSSGSVGGTISMQPTHGCAVFDSLVLTAQPDSTLTVTFAVAAFGISQSVNVTLRACHVGETEIVGAAGQCVTCASGTYGVEGTSGLECMSCPTGAVCYGGSTIRALGGAWTSSKTSTASTTDSVKYVSCSPSSVCLGDEKLCSTAEVVPGSDGYFRSLRLLDPGCLLNSPLESGDTIWVDGVITALEVESVDSSTGVVTLSDKYAVDGLISSGTVYKAQDAQCSVGNTGNLCYNCAKGYGKLGFSNTCSKCPGNSAVGVVLFLLGLVAMCLLAVVAVKFYLATKKTQALGITFKIAISFLQVLTVLASIPLDWPKLLLVQLNIAGILSFVGEQILSLDCLIQGWGGLPLFYAKFLFFVLFPLIIIALCALFWVMRYRNVQHKMRQPWAAVQAHAASQDQCIPLTDITEVFQSAGVHIRPSRQTSLQLFTQTELVQALSSKAPFVRAAPIAPMASIRETSVGWETTRHEWRSSDRQFSRSTASPAPAAPGVEGVLEASAAVHVDTLRETYYRLLRKLYLKKFFISVLILLYLAHPNVSYYALSVFSCRRLDGSEYYLALDPDTRCYTPSHKAWMFALGLPAVLLWVIGIPLTLGRALWMANNDGDHISDRFNFCTYGYKESYYYWEVMVMFYKVGLVVCAVFGSLVDPMFAGFLCLLMIVVLMDCQSRLKPFEDRLDNRCAITASRASLVTLLVSMVLYSAGLSQGWTSALTIATFVVNILALLTIIVYSAKILRAEARARKQPEMQGLKTLETVDEEAKRPDSPGVPSRRLSKDASVSLAMGHMLTDPRHAVAVSEQYNRSGPPLPQLQADGSAYPSRNWGGLTSLNSIASKASSTLSRPMSSLGLLSRRSSTISEEAVEEANDGEFSREPSLVPPRGVTHQTSSTISTLFKTKAQGSLLATPVSANGGHAAPANQPSFITHFFTGDHPK